MPGPVAAIGQGSRPADSGGVGGVLTFLVDKPLAMAGIVVAALIINKLARRVVKIVVRRLGHRRADAAAAWSVASRPPRCATPASS